MQDVSQGVFYIATETAKQTRRPGVFVFVFVATSPPGEKKCFFHSSFSRVYVRNALAVF